MDTLQTKSEAACNDLARKKTPPQAYSGTDRSSTTDNGSAAAETGSRSQATNGEGNGLAGADVEGEGARG